MINRINGVNFTAIYGGTTAVGWHKMVLPPGFTWYGYLQFLLGTLPAETRLNYQEKLDVSIRFWREKGGCLSEATIEKLKEAGVQFTVGEKSSYKTSKRPVRMEYLDDIQIPEFRELPTFRRVCICILKNDHTCRYMGFAPTKKEKARRDMILEKYSFLF